MVTCSTSYSGEPVFVLAYNLVRPGTFERGAYPRTMKRLALFGAVASVPFIALGGLFAGWWPLNVLFTLLVITATLYLVERGGAGNLIAAGRARPLQRHTRRLLLHRCLQ